MGVSFALARPGNDRSSIRIKVSVDGSHILLYPGKSVLSSDWDKRKCFVKTSAGQGSTNRLAKALRELERQILDVLDQYKNGTPKFSYNELKSKLQALIDNPRAKFNSVKEKVADTEETLNSFFELFILDCENGIRLSPQRRKITPSTIADYKKTLRRMAKYQSETEGIITLKEFGQSDLDKLSDYLVIDLELAMNTHAKVLTHLQQVIKYAVKLNKYPSSKLNELEFDTKCEATDAIYLTESEILELMSLEEFESPTFELVRDLFVVGCFTGMRFSDYSTIDANSIRDNKLFFIQKKTGARVTIPIHPIVSQILQKYDYNMPTIKLADFNRLIKLIGQKVPSLNAYFTKQITYNRVKTQVKQERWKFLQTHTARRSFCTNEYLRGTDSLIIMAISGHKSQTSFLRYIKVTGEQQADRMGQIWKDRMATDTVE